MSGRKMTGEQDSVQKLTFRDRNDMPVEFLSEDAIVRQLTESMRKSDRGVATLADIVSRRMREKYV